jgi:oligoendopeptidase F
MILTNETLERQTPDYYPRNFNVNNWMEVSAAFDELEHLQIDSPRDLLTLLYQSSELMQLLSEEHGELLFRTLANSNDTEAQAAIQLLLQNILIPAQKRNAAILKKYYEHPFRLQLNQDYYKQINLFFESQLENDKEENTEDALESSELSQKYRETFNRIQVEYEGNSYPLNAITNLLGQVVPEKKQAVWQARTAALQAHKQILGEILHRQIQTRTRMAKEAGYQNYYEYALATNPTDSMTPVQTREIHASISKIILPMVKHFIKQKQKRLNLKTLRPWDLEADPEVLKLKPFSDTRELVAKAIRVLYDIRFEYGILLNKMDNSGMLDLEYRPEKVKGEFYMVKPSYNAGRILMSCTGKPRDMIMLFHEMGHILQTIVAIRSPFSIFNVLPTQAKELASQSLVYLSATGWDVFYPDKTDLKLAFRSLFEQDLMELVHWSMLNNFELILYANPDWTLEQREKAMLALCRQYDWGIDWNGLEDWQSIFWLQELTMLEYPHYSFFSALSIFSVWQILKNFRQDPMDTVSRFQRFLEKAAELTTGEMYQELNIRHDLSEKNMRRMMDFLLSEYKRIGK